MHRRKIKLYLKDFLRWIFISKERQMWGSLYRMMRISYIFSRDHTVKHFLFILKHMAPGGEDA
jgi:hypothetical protein